MFPEHPSSGANMQSRDAHALGTARGGALAGRGCLLPPHCPLSLKAKGRESRPGPSPSPLFLAPALGDSYSPSRRQKQIFLGKSPTSERMCSSCQGAVLPTHHAFKTTEVPPSLITQFSGSHNGPATF